VRNPLGIVVWLGVLIFPATGPAQTSIDLRTQSKSVDFGEAISTRPMKTGTSLPANCGVGDMFFKSDGPAGSNVYGCTATDTWSLIGGGTGGGDVVGPGTSLDGALAIYSGTSGNLIAEAAGCSWSNTAGGQITCVGGFRSGDGTQESMVVLPELSSNGANDFRIVGAGGMAADGCIVVSGQPEAGEVLQGTGVTQPIDGKTCRIMEWAAAGSGGGTVLDFTEAQPAVALDGTDKTLASAIVPALAPGSCLEWSYLWDKVGSTEPVTYKMWFGATSVMLGSHYSPNPWLASGWVCNHSGIQSSQQVWVGQNIRSGGNQGSLPVTATASEDTTGPVTLRLTANGASDNVEVTHQMVRIY